MSEHQYDLLDRIIISFDRGLATLFTRPANGERPNPADPIENDISSLAERRLCAGLMRVNHAGEVSAQAL